MFRIYFVILLLSLLISCRGSSEFYSNKLQDIDLSKFDNCTITPRGSYLLIDFKYLDLKFSCVYCVNKDSYSFPKAFDSIVKVNQIDDVNLKITLNNTVKEFLKSGASKINGNSSVIRIYFSKKDLFVHFKANYDSISISNFFGKEKYKKIDSLYYCKPRNHLSIN